MFFFLQADSLQMHNMLEGLNAQGSFADLHAADAEGRLASRLDALMLYLKYCHGTACRFSWTHLFPGGEAKTLEEAMGKLPSGESETRSGRTEPLTIPQILNTIHTLTRYPRSTIEIAVSVST
jgi:hypothetical protein